MTQQNSQSGGETQEKNRSGNGTRGRKPPWVARTPDWHKGFRSRGWGQGNTRRRSDEQRNMDHQKTSGIRNVVCVGKKGLLPPVGAECAEEEENGPQKTLVCQSAPQMATKAKNYEKSRRLTEKVRGDWGKLVCGLTLHTIQDHL